MSLARVLPEWGERFDSTLLEHGLADEMLLLVNPVLPGKGKRLFA
jgi:dihydrofolate reductase